MARGALPVIAVTGRCMMLAGWNPARPSSGEGGSNPTTVPAAADLMVAFEGFGTCRDFEVMRRSVGEVTENGGCGMTEAATG